jgi:putative hydrolase of the HAD superfamily
LFLIFDLDDTLVDTTQTAGRYKLREVVELWSSMGVLHEPLDEAYRALCQLRQACSTGGEAITQYGEAHLIEEEAICAAERNYYSEQHEAVPIALRPETLDVLDLLKGEHRFAIVSIGRPEQQHGKMRRAGLDTSLFDYIRIVEGPKKGPVYQELVDLWGIDPGVGYQQVVVVGDRYPTDILPAQALGLRTVMIGTQPADREPDARITSLKELAPKLALWSRE